MSKGSILSSTTNQKSAKASNSVKRRRLRRSTQNRRIRLEKLEQIPMTFPAGRQLADRKSDMLKNHRATALLRRADHGIRLDRYGPPAFKNGAMTTSPAMVHENCLPRCAAVESPAAR